MKCLIMGCLLYFFRSRLILYCRLLSFVECRYKITANYSLHIAFIAGVLRAGTEKSSNGFYFTITESVILNVMKNLVVGGGDIIHCERGVAIYHYFTKYNVF